MKATELRIGNWVDQPNKGVTKVTSILNDLQIKTETGYVDKYCRPIPLTEEWLVKFGFEYSHRLGSRSFYNIVNLYIEISVPNSSVYYTSKQELICYIEYVHQLQNLYFALTGEELELT